MRKRSNWTRPSDDELRRLYIDEGRGAPEIASVVGCDPTTVRLWLIAAGVQMRPRGSNPGPHFKKGERSAFAGRRRIEAAYKQGDLFREPPAKPVQLSLTGGPA